MNAALSDVIDAHHHLWDPRLRSYEFLAELPEIDRAFGSSDLSLAVAGTAVSHTVVVQASHSAEETDWLLDLAARSNLVAGVVGWLDLQDAAVGDRIAERVGGSLVGVRHQAQDEPDPAWLVRPEVLRGLSALQDAGMPFDLLVKRPQRTAALHLVGMMPELTFVIDHLGKPDIAGGEGDEWRSWMVSMAAHPNVVCKISGLVTEASWESWRDQSLETYIGVALDLFGADRCMFGSDWPVSLLAAGYHEVLGVVDAASASLSSAERRSLFRSTAVRVYSLAVI